MPNKLFDALAGTPAPTAPTVREQITNLYGTGPRGNPNTRAAAEDLGVSQRTIQRWISRDQPPASPSGQQMVRQHASWTDSPAGRQTRIPAAREQRLRQPGTTMTLKGKVFVSPKDRRNNITRTVTVAVTGDQIAAILDASLAGNDQAAHDALEDAFADAFGGSVALTIEDL